MLRSTVLRSDSARARVLTCPGPSHFTNSLSVFHGWQGVILVRYSAQYMYATGLHNTMYLHYMYIYVSTNTVLYCFNRLTPVFDEGAGADNNNAFGSELFRVGVNRCFEKGVD